MKKSVVRGVGHGVVMALLIGGCSAPSGTAIGDPCGADTDCASGKCVGEPGGWCGASCNHSADCMTPSGPNARGAFNYCVPSATGGDQCFSGCATDADCAAFAATCLEVVALGDVKAKVCSK